MVNETRYNAMKGPGFSRVALIIIVLLAAVLIGRLTDIRAGAKDSSKKGFVLDSSEQRLKILAAQRKTNDKLDELINLLKSGQVKVQVTGKGSSASGGGGDESTGK